MSAASTTYEIEAAGGVVVRRRKSRVELVLVHRPKYDDWSLPKGKLDPGEGAESAALREVLEETGLTCRCLRRLAMVAYRDSRGRRKRVRYWLMEALEGEVEERPPDREIDEARWVERAAACRLVSYAHDRELIEAVSLDDVI
jgi:8-oxo-dGTP pyrophosphatase MutT (NUDIX family)